VRPGDRVHADAVSQQRPAGTPPGWIDQQQRHAALGRIDPVAREQLVHHARLAGPARPREADHRRRRPRAPACEFGADRLDARALARSFRLEPGDESRHGDRIGGRETRHLVVDDGDRGRAALVQEGANHSLQAECATVLGAEDARDAERGERICLLARDRAASAAVDAHIRSTERRQTIDQVAEELHVPALIGGDRHRPRVLLDRRARDLLHRAVVTEMNHLRALVLEQAPHDVDRRVVAVEERRGADHAHALQRSRIPGRRHARRVRHDRASAPPIRRATRPR
jgi:hypothetical protein